MVKTTYICDRCKNEYKYPIIAPLRLLTSRDSRIDLCQACNDELVKWLGKSTEEMEKEDE